MAEMRRCIGSTKFAIVAHDAPIDDFPKQPSQKDGLGRMCKPHWNAYTSALRKAALARKASAAEDQILEATAPKPRSAANDKPTARRRRRGQEVAELALEPPTS